MNIDNPIKKPIIKNNLNDVIVILNIKVISHADSIVTNPKIQHVISVIRIIQVITISSNLSKLNI